MCTRYWIESNEKYRAIIEEMRQSALMAQWQKTSEIKTQGEIRPTDVVPVIASNRAGKRSVFRL